jgi:cell division protein FtsL
MVRRKWSGREMALGAAFLFAVVGILTFYVWYQTESVRLGIEIGRSEARIRELQDSIRALELRKAALLDPGRVERLAREKLGLVDPRDEDTIYEERAAAR